MSQKDEFHNLDNPHDGLFRDLAPGLTTRIFAGEQAMLSAVTLAPHSEGTLTPTVASIFPDERALNVG